MLRACRRCHMTCFSASSSKIVCPASIQPRMRYGGTVKELGRLVRVTKMFSVVVAPGTRSVVGDLLHRRAVMIARMQARSECNEDAFATAGILTKRTHARASMSATKAVTILTTAATPSPTLLELQPARATAPRRCPAHQ